MISLHFGQANNIKLDNAIMYSSRCALKLIVINILSGMSWCSLSVINNLSLERYRNFLCVGLVFVRGEDSQQLSITSSCTCPEYETTHKCTVFSGPTTIWLGTAFENCSVDRITLRHSQFTGNDTYFFNTTCGAFGTIRAHAVSVMNDFYTSQLFMCLKA